MARRILVPLTLAPLTESKLPVAEIRARESGAELILLHVLPPRARDPGTVSPEEAAARAYLDTLATGLKSSGVSARPLVRAGSVAPLIIETAVIQCAELIVLGCNVRPRLPSLLRGSVADRVIKHAPCPALLVRPDGPTTTPHALRSFADDAARAGPLTRRSLGTRMADMARIVGSVGRVHELGADFRPLKPRPEDEARYSEAFTLRLRREMPPVELYKLGFGYYVTDGHHRVAVARQRGDRQIEANITEFVSTADTAAHRAFALRRAFEQSTGLTRIGATRPETYARFTELLRAEIWAAGAGDDQAAAHRWHDEVFHPLRRRIREADLLRFFPGERAADVIARLATWRDAEGERLGQALSWDEAFDRFASALAENGDADIPG